MASPVVTTKTTTTGVVGALLQKAVSSSPLSLSLSSDGDKSRTFSTPDSTTTTTVPSHIILPSRYNHPLSSQSQKEEAAAATQTLREFLTDPRGFYLAMAPAFFGFYGYFGALAAWDEELSRPSTNVTSSNDHDEDDPSFRVLVDRIQGVAGASAGAMAAVLVSEAIPPRIAADFCSTMTLDKFADGPGLLAAFRGIRGKSSKSLHKMFVDI